MNVFLWIVQILLAAASALAGVMKATQPKEQLQSRLPWVEDFSPGTVRFIGIVELLGALGLILTSIRARTCAATEARHPRPTAQTPRSGRR